MGGSLLGESCTVACWAGATDAGADVPLCYSTIALQAMALKHTTGIEVACNLLDADQTPPEAVAARVAELAAAAGMQLGQPYRIGKTPEHIMQLATEAGLTE